MKYIKLQIHSIDKNNLIIKLLNKHNIKFFNNFYLVDDSQFKKLKKEIGNADSNLTIKPNNDYVIIRMKMGRTPPQPKYLTLNEAKKIFLSKQEAKKIFLSKQEAKELFVSKDDFNRFVKVMTDFVSEQKEFNKEQKQFNKKVETYIDKHPQP